MAKYNGTKLKLLSDGIALSNLKNITLTVNGATVDVTDKDSSGWKEILTGLKDWQISGECELNSASTLPASTLFARISAGTSCAVIFYHSVTGQLSYSGSGYYTKFEQKGGTEDNITISWSLMGTGALTQTATT